MAGEGPPGPNCPTMMLPYLSPLCSSAAVLVIGNFISLRQRSDEERARAASAAAEAVAAGVEVEEAEAELVEMLAQIALEPVHSLQLGKKLGEGEFGPAITANSMLCALKTIDKKGIMLQDGM